MKLNSLKLVHCKIDSGNELPRSLRLGPNLWINMDSTILISYLLLLFTSLKFSNLMGWSKSRACWRILLLGGTLSHLWKACKLHYLGLNSHKITKDIKTVISKYYPQIQLNIVLINSNTLNKMFPFKNKIPYLCCSCVIYKYQCDQWSSSYIGETQKQLKYRIFQHKGVSCRTGNRLTCPPNSNIRQHAHDFDHPIKLENFKLVNIKVINMKLK